MSDCSEPKSDGDFASPGVELARLPAPVQGRVKALKNLQMETVKAEAEYYMEVHKLDFKYQQTFDQIQQRRSKVVSGAYEPSGAEVEWPSEDEEEEEDEEIKLAKKTEALELDPDFPADCKGIPKFWLHVLRNANEEALMGLVEPHDEPVLEHLTDITISLTPDNAGFTLHFHFQPNPFFTNSVLTKEYVLRHDPDPDQPLAYDGPEIVSCKGCTIDWKEGKNVTLTTVKVKTVNKRKGGKSDSPVKRITKEIKADSFFAFFSPPLVKEDGEVEDDDDQAILAVDFDVGFALKDRVVPKAILFFTGEIFDGDDDDDEDFEDCEDEDEDDEEDEA